MPNQKHIVTGLVISLILVVLWALLLIFLPLPIKDKMDAASLDAIVVEQGRRDRWAEVPGTLGYNYTRSLRGLTLPTLEDADGLENDGGDPPKGGYSLDLRVNYTFENVEYNPVQSVVEYSDRYDYHLIGDGPALNETVSAPNYGALSVWQ